MPDLLERTDEDTTEAERDEPVAGDGDTAPAAMPDTSRAEEGAETDAPAPRGPLDFDDLIDPANGKIYGKFDDPIQAARAYKEAEKQMGRKSQEAAELRKTLEAAGYTFDAAGKPVPPTKPESPEAAAQAQQQEETPPAPTQELPFDQAVTEKDGVAYNFLGMPILSDDEWEELRQSDERAYFRTVAQYEQQQAQRLTQFREQRRAERQSHLEQTRQEVRRVALEKHQLPPEFMDAVEKKVQAEVLPTLAPELRGDPQAYKFAMQLQAAEMMPAYYRGLMEQALSENKEVAAKAQRTIRTERGAVTTPAKTETNDGALSPDERRMCKDLGISENDFLKNRDRS